MIPKDQERAKRKLEGLGLLLQGMASKGTAAMGAVIKESWREALTEVPAVTVMLQVPKAMADASASYGIPIAEFALDAITTNPLWAGELEKSKELRALHDLVHEKIRAKLLEPSS